MAYPVAESYNSNSSNSASSITITKPTGLAEGDLMVAYINSLGATHSQTTPSGWTAQYKQQYIPGNNIFYAGMYTKVANATDVAASNFTFALSTATGIGGTLVRISGVASGNEVEVVSVSVDADGTSTASFTSAITPRMTETLCVMGIYKFDNGGGISGYATTPAKTWTEVSEVTWAVGGYDPAIAVAQANSGSTAEITAFQAGVTSGTERIVGSLLLINSPQSFTVSNALLQTTPVTFSPLTGSTQSCTNDYMDISPDFPNQSGEATVPSVWTTITKS